MCFSLLMDVVILLHSTRLIDGPSSDAHDRAAMAMLKFFKTIVLGLAITLSSTLAAATPAPVTPPSIPIPARHIVVLSYTTGEQYMQVQSIDGKSASSWLPADQILEPLLHTAVYYAGFILLTSTAVYFKNAELLTIISLSGLPVLLVVGVRDLARILNRNGVSGGNSIR